MPTLTTKLQAVNTILGAAGEAPVNSLTGATMDVAQAESLVDELSRTVQDEGWVFNTEKDVPLTRQPDGTIPIPANVLSIDVDPAEFRDVSPVLRGSRLYDAKGHSYAFPQDLKAEVVYHLDWEDLPESARYYITVRAARVYHDRYIGSDTQHQFTAEDETRARMALQGRQMDDADLTIFDHPEMAYRQLRR